MPCSKYKGKQRKLCFATSKWKKWSKFKMAKKKQEKQKRKEDNLIYCFIF